MNTLRSLFAWTSRDALSRLSMPRLLALFLILIVPGGLVVPICCGIYGALRHTLSSKVASRSIETAPAASPLEAPPR